MLLDGLLPGMSGIELCRQLRASRQQVPILMLSALTATKHRVAGLRVGADDNLPKPFKFDELVARIVALHRRSSETAGGALDNSDLNVGPLSYSPASKRVFLDGPEIDLSGKERAVLIVLIKNAERVIARKRLLNSVWGLDADPLTNVVDVTVSRIRRKIGTFGDAIATVRGCGYRLNK